MHDILLYHASVDWAIDLLSVENFAELLVVREDLQKQRKQYRSSLMTHQLTELLQQSPVRRLISYNHISQGCSMQDGDIVVHSVELHLLIIAKELIFLCIEY